MNEKRAILLGITGGIAAYKSAELANRLSKKGYSVHVVMTRGATAFVGRLTFESLTGNPVNVGMFSEEHIEPRFFKHIALARSGYLFLIAPATANVIAKLACGIADDLLTTTFLTYEGTVMVAPAMNSSIYRNEAFQENLSKLESRGIEIIPVQEGLLACGEEGPGKMASVEEIEARVDSFFETKDRLAGKRVLVTAGATREPVDPVRFITNRSSGYLGLAIAAELRRQGADVALVHTLSEIGHGGFPVTKQVNTADEMRAAVLSEFENRDAVVMAAAVADFKPGNSMAQKIKRGDRGIDLSLEQTTDILKELGEKKGHRRLIGFSIETDGGLKEAKRKLVEKNLDAIVAVDLRPESSPYGKEALLSGSLIQRKGEEEQFENIGKWKLAKRIASLLSTI